MKSTGLSAMAIAALFALLPLVAAGEGAAAEGVTAKPFLCAVTEGAQCQETEGCVKGPARLFNLPVMFRIDFQRKTAESVREGGERRVSRIGQVDARGDTIILQGADEATAWIATIGSSSGNMTVVAAREGQAFVVFGTCTPL